MGNLLDNIHLLYRGGSGGWRGVKLIVGKWVVMMGDGFK
jgi:hypothetical protein